MGVELVRFLDASKRLHATRARLSLVTLSRGGERSLCGTYARPSEAKRRATTTEPDDDGTLENNGGVALHLHRVPPTQRMHSHDARACGARES